MNKRGRQRDGYEEEILQKDGMMMMMKGRGKENKGMRGVGLYGNKDMRGGQKQRRKDREIKAVEVWSRNSLLLPVWIKFFFNPNNEFSALLVWTEAFLLLFLDKLPSICSKRLTRFSFA